MKKKTIIIILVLLVIALIAILVWTSSSSSKTTLKTSSDVTSMFTSLYSKHEENLPSLETQEIDVTDASMVQFYTGLTSNEYVDFLVVSEPMMSSQAYSAVALKVKDGADVEAMKEEMLENIDTNKWICVSASKVYITNHHDVIFLIMADDTWANLVYDEFKNFVNNDIGKELEKTSEENIELPPEIILQ